VSPSDVNVILARLEAMHEDIGELKEQTKITNGRVGKLELWQARVEGAKWAVSWAPPLVTAAGAAVLGGIAAKLLGI
jgi:hypothetical protein